MLKIFVKVLAALLALISTSIPQGIGVGVTPSGQKLDLDKFELTWSDEFNGDKIDSTKWATEWWVTMRKGGYWHEDMLSVKDGNLIISAEYKDKPLENRYYDKWHEQINFDEYKPGWYTSMLTTRDKFEQKYGYFEVRCILPAATGMWSAFWMMNEGVYNVNGSGQDGTEVDIFESMYYKDHWWGRDAVSTGIHYDGYDEGHKNVGLGSYLIENNPYEEYNTYGVEWNENEYIFYINGVESCRTSAGGVSQNPEYLLLSCEFAGDNGVQSSDRHGTGKISLTPDKNWPAKFVVDYVRCYQYK
ncbi:MAG: glycoside hydrolase family 16 protein [Clostridia bacterium]|nr:glycoside hydrolase family 16 protein [Clostridia bacterium]